jgi:hypothetical protein
MILNIEEAENFNNWMKNTVKSLHYSNHERMTNALTKIEALKYNPIN